MTRHLLTLEDLSAAGFWGLIDQAASIKQRPSRYIRALYEKTLLMIFEAPSLRTRLSFETAMTQLHGHAINYYTVHSPWGVGKESIEDVARTVSRYCDAVTARLYDHAELVRLAGHATVPVINAMTDAGHPCQVLGDFLTMWEKLGHREGLHIAYVGDCRNNVTYSLMRAAKLTGSHLVLSGPQDPAYRPDPVILAGIEAMPAHRDARIEFVPEPAVALAGAQVVYADSWMSYRVPEEERAQRLHDLERWRVTEELLENAAFEAIFMHCLPAMRGQEVTAGVIDGPRSVVFDQAENRLHVQKAVLLEWIGESPPVEPLFPSH